MILIAKPEKIKSTRPLARSRRTNYLWPISMAQPRVNALRFGKGQHYRDTLCTRLDLEHSWRPGMAPETAARCRLEMGEDRDVFLVLREPTRARRAQTPRRDEVAQTAQIEVTILLIREKLREEIGSISNAEKKVLHRPVRHRSAPDEVETKDEKPARRQEKNEDRGSGDDNDSDDDRRLVITIRVRVR
ncbi:hypothetical protein G5I_00698 [Acromyrmex echinatior]|uniref:Uncharacterized protein n=1 Tax=Acromyrmex echinatior TaxID=103372 RepID=F4W5K1_ACREC|nr:hypothetical protein G5I_00698 [Acromyrmex echinatior]